MFDQFKSLQHLSLEGRIPLVPARSTWNPPALALDQTRAADMSSLLNELRRVTLGVFLPAAPQLSLILFDRIDSV